MVTHACNPKLLGDRGKRLRCSSVQPHSQSKVHETLSQTNKQNKIIGACQTPVTETNENFNGVEGLGCGHSGLLLQDCVSTEHQGKRVWQMRMLTLGPLLWPGSKRREEGKDRARKKKRKKRDRDKRGRERSHWLDLASSCLGPTSKRVPAFQWHQELRTKPSTHGTLEGTFKSQAQLGGPEAEDANVRHGDSPASAHCCWQHILWVYFSVWAVWAVWAPGVTKAAEPSRIFVQSMSPSPGCWREQSPDYYCLHAHAEDVGLRTSSLHQTETKRCQKDFPDCGSREYLLDPDA